MKVTVSELAPPLITDAPDKLLSEKNKESSSPPPSMELATRVFVPLKMSVSSPAPPSREELVKLTEKVPISAPAP